MFEVSLGSNKGFTKQLFKGFHLHIGHLQVHVPQKQIKARGGGGGGLHGAFEVSLGSNKGFPKQLFKGLHLHICHLQGQVALKQVKAQTLRALAAAEFESVFSLSLRNFLASLESLSTSLVILYED